jgi:hypothetical protein
MISWNSNMILAIKFIKALVKAFRLFWQGISIPHSRLDFVPAETFSKPGQFECLYVSNTDLQFDKPMNVVSVRIPEKLKKKMDSLGGVVNWSEEIRRFIESRVREIEQERVIGELGKLIQELPPVPKGYAVRLVREDRDSG